LAPPLAPLLVKSNFGTLWRSDRGNRQADSLESADCRFEPSLPNRSRRDDQVHSQSPDGNTAKPIAICIRPLTEQPEIRAGWPGDTAIKDLSHRSIRSGQQLLQTRCNGMGAAHAARPRRHERRRADCITRDRQATTLATTRASHDQGERSKAEACPRRSRSRRGQQSIASCPDLRHNFGARPTCRNNQEGIVPWHDTPRGAISPLRP
jgi:hypothetical protein